MFRERIPTIERKAIDMRITA